MNIFGTTGQERRAWLDRQGQNVLDAIQYYAGPGIPVNAFATVADMFNPVADIQRAGTAARGAVQPGLTASERAGYVGSALTDMASVLAPVAGAAYADDAARGLTEGLANWSMPADDAMTRFVVDDSGAFAGIRAKTADLDALGRAQAMTEAGASRDDVWNETGWFQGVDGKWRFEIDDYASTFRGTGTPSEIARVRGDTVGDAFYHWNAFKAYPDLRDVRFKGGEPGALKGAYMPSFDIMVPDAIMVSDGVQDARSTMLHELQHAIQGREGFAVGANPGEYASGAMFHRRARKLQEALSRELTGGLSFTPKEIEQNLRYGVPERLQEIADMHGFRSIDEAIEFLRREDEMRTPFSQYQRTAGEVEARNVQARQNFTADQRRAVPPWLTQDVPDDQQIIRGILQKYGVE